MTKAAFATLAVILTGMHSQAHADKCTVTSRALNLRAKATTNSTIKDSLDRGDVVTCDPSRKDGNWIYVTTSGGKEGWMSLEYMKQEAAAEGNVKANPGASVNVRSRPSTNGKILDNLSGGKTLPLSQTCSSTNSWHAVDLGGGKCGYVSKTYTEAVMTETPDGGGEESAVPEQPAPPAEPEVTTPVSPEAPAQGGSQVLGTQSAAYVAAANYKIRTAEGFEMCTIPKNTAVTPIALSDDGQRVKVTFQNDGACPGLNEGWMAINGLRPKNQKMKVDVTDSLAMRASAEGNAVCDLPENHPVSVTEDYPTSHQFRAWVKIKLDQAIPGCPTEGWVNREYLKANQPELDNLPREMAVYDDSPEAALPEGCDGTCGQTIKDLKDVAQGVRQVGDISTWKSNRGLVQIPTKGQYGNVGPCGSFHPNADTYNGNKVTDNYAKPITACVMMAFMQKWKAAQDAKGGGDIRQKGTRMQWGDISDRTRQYYSNHKTHTDGECVDFRPMRKGGFDNSALQYNWANYDREATREFIEMAISMGGTPVYFNDPEFRKGDNKIASYSGGHDNHLHICFPSNRKTRATCDNYQYDPNICGGL